MSALRAIVAAAMLAAAPAKAEFSFVVIGDTPYNAADGRMLDAAVLEIERRRPPFVIHLGDFKDGSAPCDGSGDDAFANLIETLKPIPVFATPGDNDWTDCDRGDDPKTGKPYSELGRLAALRARFYSGPPTGGASFMAERQQGQPENQRWSHGGVFFATLHVVGTEEGLSFVNGDPLAAAEAAASARRKANVAWVAAAASLAKTNKSKALVFALQADMTDIRPQTVGKTCAGASVKFNPCDPFIAVRAAIRAAAKNFGGPVLVIHGDTTPFTLNRNFADGGAPNLWRLNAAGDGVRDVTLVTIGDGAGAPFSARGLVTGRPAKKRD